MASPAERRSFLASVFIGCGVLLASLLAAHALIIVVYDLTPLFLRIASLAIPLPFGFALYFRHAGHGWALAISAALAACVAVLGMSAVTGRLDNMPVLPSELRELIEYAASIAFSFLTGLLLGKLRHHRIYGAAAPNRALVFAAQLFAADEHGQLRLQRAIIRIAEFVAAVAPAASGAISVYTGIKAVIG